MKHYTTCGLASIFSLLMILCTVLQACYGHTEGTAGITGLLLAACALQAAYTVPIVNLRDINPYVAAAIGDIKHMSAYAPRQLAPGALLVGTQAQLPTVGHAVLMQFLPNRSWPVMRP